MRRAVALAVDTTSTPTANTNESAVAEYQISQSPRSSITDLKEIPLSPSQSLSPSASAQDLPSSSPSPPVLPKPQPSIRLLFSFLSRRHRICLLLPASLSSIIAGGIAPFMTYVIGEQFNTFAAYPTAPNPPQSAKDALLHGVGMAALELVGLGVGALMMSSVTSTLWIWTGEHNVVELRRRVYEAVSKKDLAWFDTRMGADGAAVDVQDASSSDGPVGAGGLMAKFTRETDEVRTASSLASGQLFQYLTTCLTALILAFYWSPLLTLVILSAVPLLILIQGFSQGLATPLLASERAHMASAATLVERSVTAIATVKAFNAVPHEEANLSAVLDRMSVAARRLARVWAGTAGMSQFTSMAMFVQGFWFGAHLVRQGKNTPGDVMSVFWACLIATSNLQMSVPLLVVLEKGKAAAAELVGIVQSEASLPSSSQASTVPPLLSPSSTLTLVPLAKSKSRRVQQIRRIHPQTFIGEIQLSNLTFAYPSRPTQPVLTDVSMFMPSRETTFIVGSSGSGKSTLSAVLMGSYTPQANEGCIFVDNQDIRYLDGAYLRKHFAGVSQGSAGSGGCPIFEGTLHYNIAIGAVGSGRRVEEVTRDEVEEACRLAMLTEWVKGLDDGLDTVLSTSGSGGSGVMLSGGQRQRLAIARARIRNPDVLILDEATSALDPPTRALILAAIRRWRRNRTTIVITHDLANIERDDFIYVLRSGCVVEQGYRSDLEANVTRDADGHILSEGEFFSMLRTFGSPDPSPNYDESEGNAVAQILAVEEELEEEEREDEERKRIGRLSVAPTIATGLRPVTATLGNWMFDVIAELTQSAHPPRMPPAIRELQGDENAREKSVWRVSHFVPADAFAEEMSGLPDMKRRPSSLTLHIPSPTFPQKSYDGIAIGRRFSLQFTPTSPKDQSFQGLGGVFPHADDDGGFADEKHTLERSAMQAAGRRERRAERKRHDMLQAVIVDEKPLTRFSERLRFRASRRNGQTDKQQTSSTTTPSLIPFLRTVWPTLPRKPLVMVGLLACMLSGLMTPVFSFVLSQLMYLVSDGASDASLINTYGGLVLGIAALDGCLLGAKYFIMESTAMTWVTERRRQAFALLMRQDKAWFDNAENGAAHITQVLVKDADDARTLIAVVMGQCVVVTTMLGVGLVWAMVWGWQLTLVGLAIAPVFICVMRLQASWMAKCEVNNKRAREEVARVYYESILNVRGVRAMALEPILQAQFDAAAARCLSTGKQGAFVEGCSFGVASALIYLAEALLFYMGAILMANGTYTYLQMVQVLDLVVFTVTIGSQLMAFTQKIAKSVRATMDLNELFKLDSNTAEAQGILKPQLNGDLTFNNVSFNYPSKPDIQVLKNLSMKVTEGECVAVVGGSGCGKSTVAALLQRLYEPVSGTIALGLNDLHSIDTKHLREHVAVVSQNPNLFDASIRENIKYGREDLSEEDVVRAAKAANVHDFVMSLPQAYDTMVGENAGLISGGQAQRLQIARALARPSRILILDECTSALDPANQAAVMDTISSAKVGRTTIMITHKVSVMKMCDRILVLVDGEMREQGTYEDLMERRGVFAKLANGGEWIGD